MAQGFFCSLLIGTIVKTLDLQFSIPFLIEVGSFCSGGPSHYRQRLAGYVADLPYSSGCPKPVFWNDLPKTGLDPGRRFKTGLKIRGVTQPCNTPDIGFMPYI